MSRNLFTILLVSLFCGLPSITKAQDVGISFSYFLPKNGDFSTPISPFSIRGIGIGLGDYFALQTGFSLYRMSGMNVKDMGDLKSDKSIVGPNFTLMIPAELVLQFIGQQQEFRIKGGGFAFQTFDNKLNYGNLDKAIRNHEGWAVANADFDIDPGIGLGYYFGAEYVIYVTKQWGLSFEANYFIGDADFPLKGSYTGGNIAGPLETKNVEFKDAKLDFTGLEISIGVIITQ